MDTPFSLSPELKAKIEREANARGMSVADFVRESLELAIEHKAADDPLFADSAVFRDEGPSDFASNHDDYLNEDAS